MDLFERYARNKDIRASRVGGARSVADGADIVVTMTPATQPVLQLADVRNAVCPCSSTCNSAHPRPPSVRLLVPGRGYRGFSEEAERG